ncbi:STE/STE20 protein kinase [Capronia coronata CBS 617.96]|uniref:STE/STE20 protein kinase n=1 Tax=Capronia coronata CBS 617.96 TaxID=1182541 RepID=W9Y9A9_9EURO|nr:STE/STE20 protein kinase [Capronia coronata CBS 617.96]EXJ86240.1 STE/STE20 protein kinase [Capronia coronata CBS 617.96]
MDGNVSQLTSSTAASNTRYFRTQSRESVIIKSVNHWRLQNERDVLLRFQQRTPFLRPLLDEVRDASAFQANVLRYLDDDLLNASNTKRLTSFEVKYVAKRILGGLKVLHNDGFVHTDIKPSNVLFNYKDGSNRFGDVQLADFESAVHKDTSHAQNGEPIGTPMFRSPEAHLQMRWDTATDIWSFGALLISLLYGEGFHIFKPNVPPEHDDYDYEILLKYNRIFGPFPVSYEEIADQDRLAVLVFLTQNSPPETLKPFNLTTAREICEEDKEFVLKIMKLDPRDRPTASELLEDQWFRDE